MDNVHSNICVDVKKIYYNLLSSSCLYPSPSPQDDDYVVYCNDVHALCDVPCDVPCNAA